jgi:uncharacterized membrane protein
MGGIGSWLMVAGFIGQIVSLAQLLFPNFALLGLGSLTGVFSLVGFILFLVAMYGFSKDYKNNAIFDNLLYGLVVAIVTGVVAFALIFLFFLFNFNSIIPNVSPAVVRPIAVAPSVSLILRPILPAVALPAIASAFFTMRAFNRLAENSKVESFKTAGKVLVIGALLSLILLTLTALLLPDSTITLVAILAITSAANLVQYFGWGLAARAFLRIKAPPTSPLASPAVQAFPPVSGQVKYCSYCGAENKADAAYCTRCGKKALI